MSPINTGFVGPAVATALTVYGIETHMLQRFRMYTTMLQQHLPFTVLKHCSSTHSYFSSFFVATALTVYGIETLSREESPRSFHLLQQHLPFTVLKQHIAQLLELLHYRLQQHLPFTVLKLTSHFLQRHNP